MKKASWTAAAAIAIAAVFPAAARGAPGEWRWPVRGAVITHYLNDAARPYAGGMHRGIDIGAAVGTEVVAARGGHVTYAGALGSAGLTVAIATADGRYATSYLHLSRIDVARGESVAAGERLGAVGTSGHRSARRPHLHFGVRIAGTDHAYVDPTTLLPPLLGGAERAPAPVRVKPAPVPAGPVAVPVRHLRPELGRIPPPVPVTRGTAHGLDWGKLVFCAGLALLGAALVRPLRPVRRERAEQAPAAAEAAQPAVALELAPQMQ